jgi:uncharacterized protein YjbJ (UPF0337 family)
MTNWTFLGWHYRQGGEQVGPVSSDEIDRLVGCVQLQPSEEVWKRWQDASHKVRFFGSQADPEARPIPTEGAMNWVELQCDWKGMRSLLKTYWTRLTDRDLEEIDGRRDKLGASLQRLYSYGGEEAEAAIASFEKDVRFPGAVK